MDLSNLSAIFSEFISSTLGRIVMSVLNLFYQLMYPANAAAANAAADAAAAAATTTAPAPQGN